MEPSLSPRAEPQHPLPKVRLRVLGVTLVASLLSVSLPAPVSALQADPNTSAPASVAPASAPAPTKPSPPPKGTGCLAGPGLNLTIVAPGGSTGTGSTPARGRVEIVGPSGVTLFGAYQCIARDWRIVVDGGVATVAGLTLPRQAFAGTITSTAGVIVSDVTATLANDAELIRGWTQRGALAIGYSSTGVVGLVAEVRLSASRRTSTLTLAGPLLSNGTYRLAASGSLMVLGTAVPFKGELHSIGYPDGDRTRATPWWDITASFADAAGGRVPISGAAAIVGGSLGTRSPAPPIAPAAVTATPSLVPAPSAASTTSSFSSTVAVSIDGTSYTIAMDLEYTDDANWVLTATATTGAAWSPPGMTNLVIPPQNIHGTVTSVAAVVTWNMTIDEIQWHDVVTGSDLTTGFVVSNECPLPANCPGIDGIYIGLTGGTLEFPTQVPDLSLEGAFLTDGSWARFDAVSEDLTYNAITVAAPTLTMWKGVRTDSVDPALEMPDLSSMTNGWGVEFCGSFKVVIPDITTAETSGCVSWTPDGVVMGQVAQGGDVTSGASNGVTIGVTTLNGFAWTNLTTAPVITLNGLALPLDVGRNELTAAMAIPATLMEAVGAGHAAATIPATGWFTTAGDFSLDGDIAVNMKSGGFTLESVSVHIGKEDEAFSLGLGANATVSVSGNHFPVTAYVGVDVGGGSNDIIVRLSVQGTTSKQPDGGFDTPTLLPTGNFEPDLPSLVNGGFDDRPSKDVLDDTDFENAVATDNLFTNDGFETGVSNNLLANGDLEDGSVGNLLTNGDLEDTNTLINGDFETGSTSSWSLTSSAYTSTIVAGTAPSGDEGTSYVSLKNVSSTVTGAGGLLHNIAVPGYQGASYTFAVWVKSTDNSRVTLYVSQQGNLAGCPTTGNIDSSQFINTTTAWSQVSITVTGACKGAFQVFMNVPDAGHIVTFDAATFTMNSATSPVVVPSQVRPYVVNTMDDTPPITKSAGVYTTTDYGNPAPSLRSDGSGDYWTYNGGNWGNVSGDFDMSYDIYFPASSSRDIADLGFWLGGSLTSATGYAVRLQTAFGNTADSGVWTVSNGSVSSRLTSSPAVIPRSTWYTLRLTAVGSVLTVTVTNVADGSVFWTTTVTLPSGNRAGAFGQIKDGAGASVGHRYDNVTVYSGDVSGTQPRVVLDPANARSGKQYLALNTPSTKWSVQSSTLEAPAQNSTYTYSAWVRSRGANISGQIMLDTVGGTYESAANNFTATGTWQLVSVTLPIQQAGHIDLRPTLRNLSGAGIELDVDDMVLQAIPWRVYPTTNALTAVVPTDGTAAHAGLSGMQFNDQNNGSSVYAYTTGAPTVGGTYTVTAWIKSDAPASARLWLYAEGGSNASETASSAITTTTGWVQYRTTLSINLSHTSLRFAIDNTGGRLQIDDVVVSGAQVNLPPDTATAWTTTTTGLGLRLDPPNAHSGSAFMQYTMPSGTTGRITRTVSGSGLNGNTYIGSVWVRATAANVSGTLTLASGALSAATNFTATSNWQQVSVNLLLNAATTSFTLSIDHKTATQPLLVDDTAVQLVGLSQKLPWVPVAGTGGTLAVGVFADSTKAYQSTNFLEVQSNTTAGYVKNDVATSLVKGQSYTFSAWVRSPAGTSVTGSLQLTGMGGTTAETAETTFTATAAWQQVFVTLPVTLTNPTLRSAIKVTTLGQKLDIDTVSTRQMTTWLPWGTDAVGGKPVNELVVTDPSSAASGSSYLTITNPNNAFAGFRSTVAVTVNAAAKYTMQAYVRSTTGGSIGGRLVFGGSGSASDTVVLPFTATTDWQLVTLPFTATTSNGLLSAQVDLATAGQLDIDSIVVTQQLIVQSDPWINSVGSGGSVTAAIYDDATRAHDSSGVLQISKTGSSDSGVFHDIALTVAAGSTYLGSVWVRSSSGAAIAGQLSLSTNGGSTESAVAAFTATDTWQLVSVALPVASTGHTGLRAAIVLRTAGVTLDVDDVVVQPSSPWVTWADSGGSVVKTQRNDGLNAQSGSGYLSVVTSASPAAGVQLDTTGSVAVGTSQTATAYVRSASGAPAPGRLQLLALGGTSSDSAIVSFTATTQWQKISVTVPIVTAGQTSMRTKLYVDGPNLGIDIDTVTLGEEPLGAPDGVTTALPHPESGYAYLWDDAFGIPGAHLWAMTAQIEFVNGFPGLGVGATMYFDPTQAPTVMTGTGWLKGDMSLNLSEADPCFSFEFNAPAGSGIEIQGGVFTTTNFLINFAPRGCEVGPYVVLPGATLAFDSGFGDSTLHFDLEIGRDDDGLPTFYTDMAVTDLTLGGTLYRTMQLTVDITAEAQSVAFVGDFTMPMGNFYGTFQLSMDSSLIHMEGQVTLTGWQLAGGTMNVSSFNYFQSTDIPVGAGTCGSFDATTGGNMSIGSKTYVFNGQLAIDCGDLQLLHFDFAYYHSGGATTFNIDYQNATRVLAGGVSFTFERSTSWTFLSHRYRRNPKISLGLAFSMNIDKPSSATLTIGGTVSVSGGSGSLTCSFGGSSDDQCSIAVRITVFGSHSYNSTW